MTILNDDGAQTAAASAPTGDPVVSLTQAELDAAAESAKAEWIAVDADADFAAVSFALGDLADNLLATTVGSSITIDATAAGWGWGVGGDGSGTVLLHELGHVLGFEHGDEESLMGETLAPGEAHGAEAPAAPRRLRRSLRRPRGRSRSRTAATMPSRSRLAATVSASRSTASPRRGRSPV